jgi:hypothetical protein
MKFSIYDYKNKFLDGTEAAGADSNKIYVGTTKSEADYAYMRPGPAGSSYPAGGDVSVPYFVEFRITQGPASGKKLVLTVLGAKAVADAGGKPSFGADGKPAEPAAADFTVVGQLTVPDTAVEEATPYRVAVSSNKYKWFKVTVAEGKASAFLLRC